MQSKKGLSMIQVFILLVSLIVPFFQNGVINASSDWGNEFITNAELEDSNGNPQTSFSIYDDMRAHWDFDIPAGKAMAGDTITVDIPMVFRLATTTKFDIKDSGGVVIGRAVANPTTKKITITLTDAVSTDHNEIKGNFDLWVNWDTTQVTQDTTVPVNWGSWGSTTIDIIPSSGPDPSEVLYKWGWYDETDPTLIHWRVRINYAKQEINDAKYTDTVGGNQKLVSGSITAYNVSFYSDGNTFDINSYYPSSATIENGTAGFTTNLGNISGPVLIDYETKATDGSVSAQYENSGSLTGTNIVEQTVDVQTPNNGGGGSADTTVNIAGTKTWIDNNNANNTRPSSIMIDLYKNGIKVDSQEASASTNWKYAFNNLAKYDSTGKINNYTVKEEPVANYSSSQDGNNFINTYVPTNPTIPITPGKSESYTIIDNNLKQESDAFSIKQTQNTSNQKALPQTGEVISRAIVFIGIVLLSICGIFLLLKYRKET
ncbi:Cna B-type domain-containing protein [Ligilactobacillus sp. WILCCON 0076]|uniref:Cna B-type domain-containing protein n=1 Tax=Ligilactobacillus ubinensis TaxID=2876789 RepID=A0A9X2JM29_9LACO|nr:LPXTG cell wall anchor domain-containing protein [Ligilactobacillus ubinensis]MCP0887489.1 Cna B-type domain-containing protein [Ligilactobacillus ubinensis]